MNKHRTHVTVAGTFDRFHAGHRYLIDLACTHADKVSIGVTVQEMVQYKLLASQIQPFEERVALVTEYLSQHGYSEYSKTFPLTDTFGIARDDPTLAGVYVSGDTASNAERINRERAKKGLAEIDVIQVPFQVGDDNLPISSTRIRLGEIDREGKAFLRPFTEASIFRTTPALRGELRIPFGTVVADADEVRRRYQAQMPPVLIAVGDIISSSLIERNIMPDLSIVDGRSRRKDLTDAHAAARDPRADTVQELPPVRNEPGTISSEAALAIAHQMTALIQEEQFFRLQVEGEEDLLALPAVQAAPLGSMVVYGQFDQGVVIVEVDEEKKHYSRVLLQRFEREE